MYYIKIHLFLAKKHKIQTAQSTDIQKSPFVDFCEWDSAKAIAHIPTTTHYYVHSIILDIWNIHDNV